MLGGTLANINGLDIDDPVQFGVRTSGSNNVYLNGLDVDDSGLGANNNYGFYAPSSSSGMQSVSNSNFNGLGTAILLNNDVGTTISDTVISNGDVGLAIGTQNTANHVIDTMTISNVNTGIAADGSGDIDMTDVDITSVTTDVEITSTSFISFMDGVVDQAKVVFDSASSGKFDRDRSYIATLDADGTPLDNTNVVMSSQAAATTSSGTTDATGQTSGLSSRFMMYQATVLLITVHSSTLIQFHQ